MRKLSFVFGLALITSYLSAGAVPPQITYQGTLRKNGIPANESHQMIFRVTDSQGQQVYWSSGKIGVVCKQGLFTQTLAPTGVDWQNVTPYIQVTVDDVELGNPEPINANVYSLMSADIVDGAITPAKLNAPAFQTAGLGLIPQGAIMMFASSPCPSGWAEFTALRGRAPFGTDPGNPGQFSLGHQAGNLTHNHGGFTGSVSQPFRSAKNGSDGPLWMDHNHTIAADSSLPPYTTVIFCQKQ